MIHTAPVWKRKSSPKTGTGRRTQQGPHAGHSAAQGRQEADEQREEPESKPDTP